jgi:superfamily I DNA and/or RNA helicase
MTVFGGQHLTDKNKQTLLPDLWSTLFLVVPCISTTFASVERMIGKLPPESLGWLLIDEAGQALPQAAVGAIMRTRKAVVVGDPLQIQPVVTLPDTMTHSICKQFGIDANQFNAPEASSQTLADSATVYYAEFEGRYGARSVGVPLLVHRRCEDPMFSISNAIAYERLMVQAKKPNFSSIKEVIGPSYWMDIQGQAEDKWCPEEGKVVLDILTRLKKSGIAPNLYIITPFVVVADNLRKIIRDSGILNSWVENELIWPYERIGTVHTVQGREAEAVIFVLGAPLPQQTGARNWAGGHPNLINVAVTRAKEVLYVVGNRSLWQKAGLFKELSDRL